MDKKLIASFERNSQEQVQVSLGSYKDKVYADIRVFFKDLVSGELRPTKKGITLAVELIPALMQGLEKARTYIVKQN